MLLHDAQSPPPLLEVQHLSKRYPIYKGVFNQLVGHVHALNDVSFTVNEGEVLGVVGESGCGKSTLAKCLVRLLEPTHGTAQFMGNDWYSLKGKALQQARRHLQMVFQNPYSSLNPKMTVEQILLEPLEVFHEGTPQQRQHRLRELLNLVRLPHDALQRTPHEFSGGQRQRIGIARALALNPKLIIADEPVSALDVSVQAQILNLFQELRKELNLTIVFIGHNLSVVEYLCDRVMVMYLGRIVELAPTAQLFQQPQHPYTQALLSAMPVANPALAQEAKAKRQLLQGDLPNPLQVPTGCSFRTRCPKATDACAEQIPALEVRDAQQAPTHWVRCPY
ncbi:MAG: ABC transporter ATP-binding protein [Vampirovibrionales bacterium]